MERERVLSLNITKRAPKFISDLSGSPYSVRPNNVSPCSTKASASPRDDAAVAMQKNYRAYRTRRQIADCAVLARDYGWWNVLEGINLHRNLSVNKEQDDVTHKWIRAGKKAAKLGKGLSKDENARKLAFQHWLEAIDARHRYGHNLHKYYKVWLASGIMEPFFYWLDVGEGRQVDLKECPRAKLFEQQIQYLGPRQRKDYEVTIEDGKFYYKETGKLIDTAEADGDKWIFLMSTNGRIYVGQKVKGKFQHSSFVAGGAAKAAGRMVVSNGILELIEPHSGHYRPTEEDFKYFLRELESRGVDLSKVKVEYTSREMAKKMKSQKSSDDGKKPPKTPKTPKVQTPAAEIAKVDHKEQMVNLISTMVQQLHDEGQSTPAQSNDSENIQSQAVQVDGNGTEDHHRHEEKLLAKQRPPRLQIGRQRSFNWCSEGGARLTSLSIIPHDLRTRALEVVCTPREQTSVRCSPRCEVAALDSAILGA